MSISLNFKGPNIYALSLPKNRLTGTVPITLANLTYLQFLFLSKYKIQGTFPDIFSSIQSSLMQLGTCYTLILYFLLVPSYNHIHNYSITINKDFKLLYYIIYYIYIHLLSTEDYINK
jgi:hypothetical protein